MYDELTLDNIHCNLLLSFHEIGHGNEPRAWFQLGVAGRLCQALGLLYDSPGDGLGEVDVEMRRRTFWSWFVLERLLVNGRDRPLITFEPCVTARLPTSAADFTVGRAPVTGTLGGPSTGTDSLLSELIRVVDIMSRVVSWGAAGIGGRHVDTRSPWHEDMPFSRLQTELQHWHSSLAPYLAFSEANIKSHVAIGEGKVFGLMHLFYMTTKTRLHRKYLPFIPPLLYDPAFGPCDGPWLTEQVGSHEFWANSTREGVISAGAITRAFHSLKMHGLDLSTIPLAGISLLTSSSFHIFCAHTVWESCKEYSGQPSKELLTHNLRLLINMQESWPVAAFWVSEIPYD
jgi:hypothetical protein